MEFDVTFGKIYLWKCSNSCLYHKDQYIMHTLLHNISLYIATDFKQLTLKNKINTHQSPSFHNVSHRVLAQFLLH